MTARRASLEAVLDHAFSHSRARVIRFIVGDLASYAEGIGLDKKPNAWWSHTLQQYRLMRTARYRIVAEGYGRVAEWRAIAKAGSPAARRLGQTIDHHRFIVEDAVARELRDLDHEVLPALKINGAADADLLFRISEFEVLAVQRLMSAGFSRNDAIAWIEPRVEEVRERWAA